MSIAAIGFYVTGGTLRQNALCYVERQADSSLYEGLMRGEYCYVLTARQMGKSSLMVHTTARLREEGVAVAAFELTALGQNLTVEQWYDGLLGHIGRQLELEELIEEYWLAHERLSPLQRWMGALHEVVLARCPGRIVIFVDEIDAVRSLPFSTDEFFAAIREFYNRRTQDPEFQRLTFCLLGVASPSDLIQDTRTTPFNIGRRIELTDFSPEEAAPLAQGLGRPAPLGAALLGRVLYWTGGHPYLTQRLCQALTGDEEVTDAAGVDRHCEAFFLSPLAQERDDNVLFVRERLLHSEADQASLLDLYGQVLAGKRVPPDDTNPLVSLLRLSGIVRVVDGSLRVRNRIYARVFNRVWVTTHMPDAEFRRQQIAFRRGLMRTAAVSSVIVAVVGGLALSERNQAHRADRIAQDEAWERRRAERFLYVAVMNMAQQSWDAGNVGRAQELLETQRPQPGQEDLRGFEWHYLWRLSQSNDLFAFRGHTGQLWCVGWSPDGKTLATGSVDKTVRLWDVGSRREVAILHGHQGTITCMAFSPDGRTLATGSSDNTVRLWNLAKRQETTILRGHKGGLLSVAFSPDGYTLASGSEDNSAKLWDLAQKRNVATLTGHTDEVRGVAFSPDGKLLATGSFDHTTKLWDVATKREVVTFRGHRGVVRCVAFSPDGKILASGSVVENQPNSPGEVRLWDVASRREVTKLKGHKGLVRSVMFSPDGRILATGSLDQTVKLWDTASWRELATLKGHRDWVTSVAFSPDGKMLATGSKDETARLWDASTRQQEETLRAQSEPARSRLSNPVLNCLSLSPDGKSAATAGSDNVIRLWDLATKREIAALKGHKGWINSVAYSPDGRILASGSGDQTIRFWDVHQKRELATLQGRQGEIGPVVFSADGKLLATGGSDQTVKLWDRLPLRVGSEDHHRPSTHPSGGSRRPFVPLRAVGHRRAAVVLAVPPRELARLKAHSSGVSSLAFSPDGKILASGSHDNTARLWDVAARRPIATLKGHRAQVNSLAFSLDGKILATGSNDNTIKLWNVATAREIGALKGHTGWVISVAFSPDGKTIGTGGFDNTVRLWNVATQWEVATLKAHTAQIISVAFTPDGSTLVTASRDGTVRLWRAAAVSQTAAQKGRG